MVQVLVVVMVESVFQIQLQALLFIMLVEEEVLVKKLLVKVLVVMVVEEMVVT